MENSDVKAKQAALREAVLASARFGELEELRGVLDANPDFDLNGRNEWGQSALQNAAANGHAEVVKLLLARGADPNTKNDAGNTPLHWASLTAQVDAVAALLEGKCNVNELNAQGETALDIAYHHQHDKVMEVLMKHDGMPGKKAAAEEKRKAEEEAKEDAGSEESESESESGSAEDGK